MFILKKEHQPGVYVPLGALFLVYLKNLRWILPNPASQPKAVNSLFETLFMPTTLKKWEHIGFGLSVSACVCPSVCSKKIKLGF